MAVPQTTLLIEGSFRELADELAEYFDTAKKDENKAIKTQLAPLLEELAKHEDKGDEAEDEIDDARDKALKVLVDASAAIHQGPETRTLECPPLMTVTDVTLEFTAAYNLLIHLIRQSDDINQFLQPICRQLADPDSIASSNSATVRNALALSTLSTVFNILDNDDQVRYPVFSAVVDVIGKAGSFESLRPQLKSLDGWLALWKSSPAQTRKLLLKISSVAREAGDNEVSYEYLLRALRSIPSDDVSSEEAQALSLDALRASLLSSSHFDFEDLTALDSILALRQSNPIYYQLLEIFTSETYEEFVTFQEENPGFLSEQKLDEDVLSRKVRLLTIASLASAASQTRTLSYSSVAESLRIPAADVEMWVIDAIRVGLVEGKLSQLRKEFLIHRSTYRVFGPRQWQEVSGRLDMWRESLQGVLEVIRRQKEEMATQKEAELRGLDQKMANASVNGGRPYRTQREPVDMGLDGVGA